MARSTKFLLILVGGLALVSWGASFVVQNTTRTWFERDLILRAKLAISGARATLIAHWHDADSVALQAVLGEIVRDERIMAAGACDAGLVLLASTPGFPAEFDCRIIAVKLRTSSAPSVDWAGWHSVSKLQNGDDVHVSAIPIINSEVALGFVVLVHDLSFVERRDRTTRLFLVLAFGFLAVMASAVTIVAGRLSWRVWSDEIRRFLRGGSQRPEFLPILGDVRELVERIAAERDADSEGGVWTPQRLKQALHRHLHGEKIVIIANREPYVHERTADGGIKVVHPASGLVTALEPVLHACSGVWIAHGSGSADRDTVDRHNRVRVPPGEEAYAIRRVWLSAEDEKGYYYGFSNEGLWPLCHIAHTRPVFRSDDWKHYQAVNEKFADALCDEVDTDDPVVLLQDYHFALASRLIRDRLPRATVILFWHIPWPNAERFGICPWRAEILEGMLGASIVGFHTQLHCNNFLDSVDHFLEARLDRERHAVVQRGRSTLVRPYPISLEWPVRWVKSSPAVAECRASVISELGLAPDALLGVGVDRLDYTKGIEERLLAVERMLELFEEYRGRFTFVQLASPSRTVIERYRLLNDNVEALAARINQRFGNGEYRPIVLLRANHEPSTVFRFYRAADVCYVSSLHDGMNLVAKEFVAARDDERGILMLSQFTGAAHELTEALIVNPYDLDQAAAAFATALKMSVEEQQDRMRSMRLMVAEFNVYRWAGRMLVDAARLRSRDRIAGRLSTQVSGTVGVPR